MTRSRTHGSLLLPTENLITLSHFPVSLAIGVPNSGGEPASTIATLGVVYAVVQCCHELPLIRIMITTKYRRYTFFNIFQPKD